MKRLLAASASLAMILGASAAHAKAAPPPPRPAPAPLMSNFSSGVTAYSDAASFAANTSGTVIDNFEGVATGTNGQDYVSYGSPASGGQGIYIDPNDTTFTAQNSGYNSNLVIEGTQYGTNSNGSYGAIGSDFGSDVLSTNYNPLTITFAAPVTAFSINYAALAQAFAATATPDVFSFTIAGLGAATEGADGLTGQGTMVQAGTGFFGVTSATPFSSIVIDATDNSSGFGMNNRFYDNVTYEATAAVSAAPEPSIWMLMIVGVGLIGAALRYGRQPEAFGAV